MVGPKAAAASTALPRAPPRQHRRPRPAVRRADAAPLAVRTDDPPARATERRERAVVGATALAAAAVAAAVSPAPAVAAAPAAAAAAATTAAGAVGVVALGALAAARARASGASARKAGAESELGFRPIERPENGVSKPSANRRYFVFPPPLFPLVPAFSRETYRYEIDPGQMWCFEQKQGIGLGLNVSVNVRMTVIKLRSGGLFVHAPIAPTAECLSLLAELDAPVEYIVLPTTLFEHKIFCGPFSRRFPDAQVFIAPEQWSWPICLPSAFFGIFNSQNLAESGMPFEDEIELKMLRPPALGVARYVKFVEAAFFHKESRTLLVTDCVVNVSDKVPDCIPERDLLESGDDNNFTISALKLLNLFGIRDKAKLRTRGSEQMTKDEVLALGWQRNTLQALYFGPNNLLDPEEAWASITNRLIVAPVVATLVYENISDDVVAWARRVSKWRFRRIIPCHLDGPIEATPREFLAAFEFLPSSRPDRQPEGRFAAPWKPDPGLYFPKEDMVLLRGVADFLLGAGVIFTNDTRPKEVKVDTASTTTTVVQRQR